jgi:CBS-domain-containing membrane protein
METWSVDDVMTRAVVSVDESASYRAVVDLLITNRVSAVPVVDEHRRVTGVVSEADLLRKIEYAGEDAPRLFEARRRRGERRKAVARTVADLMSAPPVIVRTGTSITAAARLMAQEGVKRLPVVDDQGRLAGIVSRGDLLKIHQRTDEEIRSDIETGILRPFLPEEAETVTVAVVDGAVTLAGRVDRRSSAEIAERLCRGVPGVVAVSSTLAYSFDDHDVHGLRLGSQVV